MSPHTSSNIGQNIRKVRSGALKYLAMAMVLGLSVLGGIVPPHADAASHRSVKVITPHHAASSRLLPIVQHADILARHQILADKVLRALPSYCRNNLKNLYVTYEKNPASRGLAGQSTIIITGNVSDREFMALIVHECGHVTDLGGLRGTDTSKKTAFADGTTPIYGDDVSMRFYAISWLSAGMKKSGSTDADFVSGYAMSDPFEDFSESFAYFALQQKDFARLAARNPVLKAKYDFMANEIFDGNPSIAEGRSVRGRSVPWDVTKLPYIWHAKR